METLVVFTIGTVLGMMFAYPAGMFKGFKLMIYMVQEDYMRFVRNRDNTISVEIVPKDSDSQ